MTMRTMENHAGLKVAIGDFEILIAVLADNGNDPPRWIKVIRFGR